MAPPSNGQANSDRDAATVQSQCGAAQALGKVVRQERSGRRARRCLADSDADTGGGELAHVVGQAAQHAHERPAGKAERHQPGTDPGIAQTPQRDAEQRIENGEKSAVQEAEFSIAEAQVELDFTGQDRDDHAVDQVKSRDEHQQEQRVPGVAPAIDV
jgi:hypothetical protein